MSEPATYFEDMTDEGSVMLHLSGDWTITHISEIDKRLRRLTARVAGIDMSQVSAIDTIGAWLAYRTANDHHAQITGATSEALRLITEVSGSSVMISRPAISPFLRVIAEIGEAVAVALATIVQFWGFVGQVVASLFSVIIHPSRLRFNAVTLRFEMVGVRALGIVGLMSFLIGIVIAQQGAVQLKQFGAEVFTINLVGRLTFRELGVLMTAIMVAGRSGSAFAAQIGTMKITEEIDAMRTIGVSPIESLVLPRTLATILMMPLLAFYSSIITVIGGGLLCWAVLEIPPVTFIQRLREVTPMTDFYVGMIKAPIFGAIIAMAGCFQGMQVENNAEEVGLKTTLAVVQAIFLVIVLDAFFAVFFSSIGWD